MNGENGSRNPCALTLKKMLTKFFWNWLLSLKLYDEFAKPRKLYSLIVKIAVDVTRDGCMRGIFLNIRQGKSLAIQKRKEIDISTCNGHLFFQTLCVKFLKDHKRYFKNESQIAHLIHLLLIGFWSKHFLLSSTVLAFSEK